MTRSRVGPTQVQGVHVEREVHDAAVQERGGEDRHGSIHPMDGAK
jgi:hypothetical protein